MTPPLILASTSTVRRHMLTNAGVPFQAEPSDVDEDVLKDRHRGVSPAELALLLARAKAEAVSARYPGAAVLGCDQVLELDGELFDKPADRDGARRHLQRLSGRTHRLIAAAVIVRDGATVWEIVDTATLAVRSLDETYIMHYLDREGDAVLSSVGAYRLEGLGAQLFERIDGDHFTILGLPLLPLLAQLRAMGIIDT